MVAWVPTPYMEEALEFVLSHPKCALVMKPGMRKTSIALTAASLLLEHGDIKRVLVIAPVRVCQATWPNEGDKWDHLNHLNIFDLTDWDDHKRLPILKDKRVQIVLINPESAAKILDHPNFVDFGFDMLIVDECQKYKDPLAKRSKALHKKLYRFKRRLLLTGSMLANGYIDLYGQVYIMDEGERLGKNITRYRMVYFYSDPFQPYVYLPKPTTPLIVQDKIKDIVLVKQLKGNVPLPELLKNNIEVDMPEEFLIKYKELDKDYLTEVQGVGLFSPQAAVRAMKLRQFCNGFFYYDVQVPGQKPHRLAKRFHSEKIKALAQLLDELQGSPLLLGYEFEEDQAAILEAFPAAVDLGRSKRIALDIEMFNRGRIPLAIGQIGAISLGLNMQEACQDVCLYNAVFNLEHYEQFIGRVWRSGNPFLDVTVHMLITRKTRERMVAETLKDKEVSQYLFELALSGELQ